MTRGSASARRGLLAETGLGANTYRLLTGCSRHSPARADRGPCRRTTTPRGSPVRQGAGSPRGPAGSSRRPAPEPWVAALAAAPGVHPLLRRPAAGPAKRFRCAGLAVWRSRPPREPATVGVECNRAHPAGRRAVRLRSEFRARAGPGRPGDIDPGGACRGASPAERWSRARSPGGRREGGPQRRISAAGGSRSRIVPALRKPAFMATRAADPGARYVDPPHLEQAASSAPRPPPCGRRRRRRRSAPRCLALGSAHSLAAAAPLRPQDRAGMALARLEQGAGPPSTPHEAGYRTLRDERAVPRRRCSPQRRCRQTPAG